MKIAYFDCFSGISGDMILGALVDAGLDPEALVQQIDKLGLNGIALRFHKDRQGYLAGTRAEVTVEEGPRERHLPEILKRIQDSTLDDGVKNRAQKIFQRLAEAEAAVHGIDPEKVHFHEVGALDAIADIVGAVAGLALLGIDRVYSSPLTLGEGAVHCRHGLIPVPAPAVLRLTRGFEIRQTSEQREMTTPTGAAIITTLAGSTAKPASMVMEEVGYGFGQAKGERMPNALRLVLGRMPQENLEEVVLLETNLDDITGEMVGHLIHRSLREGALDAYAVPIQMKKSRPGIQFCVLAPEAHLERMRIMIHQETGTLGIRIQRVMRSIVSRETYTVETSLGPVKVKKALMPGGHARIRPEYEEVARIAGEQSLPLRRVMELLQLELTETDSH
ncbi:MAG: nickel pincer cofactor biosynthesis protein LarC [Planctomycetes bacterium]|nr:nickel pincer cofactor biosynthesis protein LarC [Planctomycetota bacterium]